MKLKKFTAIIIMYVHILNLANQKWLSHFGDLRWNDEWLNGRSSYWTQKYILILSKGNKKQTFL